MKTSFPENSKEFKRLQTYNAFNKEIEMYEVILPQIALLLKNCYCRCDIFAETFYLNYEKSAIIFEDLSLKGFRMAERSVGLDMVHTKIVLKNLAKFHGACAALKTLNPNIFQNFKYGKK